MTPFWMIGSKLAYLMRSLWHIGSKTHTQTSHNRYFSPVLVCKHGISWKVISQLSKMQIWLQWVQCSWWHSSDAVIASVQVAYHHLHHSAHTNESSSKLSNSYSAPFSEWTQLGSVIACVLTEASLIYLLATPFCPQPKPRLQLTQQPSSSKGRPSTRCGHYHEAPWLII